MSMELSFEHGREGDSTWRWAYWKENTTGEEIEFWIEIEGLHLPRPLVWDGFVYGLLLKAMATASAWGRKGALRIRGAISRQAIYNLQELQEAWRRLLPDRYQMVELQPEQIVADPPRADRGLICAFSGGVDGAFSFFRHVQASRGQASYPLEAALLVQGFDVPLERGAEFRNLAAHCGDFLRSTQRPLYTMRTNLRRDSGQDWEMSHGLLLAACFHQFAGEYAGAMLGSSPPYHDLVLPWGSTPLLDHLFATPHFDVIHDGAGFERTEKIAFLASSEAARRYLKVCWEGLQADRNCGYCPKCIRTQLAFWAHGVKDLPCFPRAVRVEEIRQLELAHKTLRWFKPVLAQARASCIQEPWMEALEVSMRRSQRALLWQQCKSYLRGRIAVDRPL